MKVVAWGLVFALIFATATLAQSRRVDLKKPLVIASQGSFFVGGEKKALPTPPAPPSGGRGGFGGGDVTVNQFRFGPAFGQTFPDGKFPIEAVDELYKQMIPDLNALLPNPNPTWKNMAALAVQLKGAILMGHSESGFFPQHAALLDPSGIRGMISIEMPCPDLSVEQIATLAKIPTLVMFGDHLGDVQGGPAHWPQSLETCNTYVKRVKDAGGDAVMMYLPQMGIKGNSHMLMQDRNSLQLADLIVDWIDKHVEKK